MKKRMLWTETEIELLKTIYEKESWENIITKIPNHSYTSIRSTAFKFGLRRAKLSAEELRIRKRNSMRRYRGTPIGYSKQLESQRKSYAKVGKDRQVTYLREIQSNNFFAWRAKRFNSALGITEGFLRDLWESQKGLCALTGKPLEGTAQLDHIIPLARGGMDVKSNFRWVIPQANRAKRELLDEEFLELCRDVVKALG